MALYAIRAAFMIPHPVTGLPHLVLNSRFGVVSKINFVIDCSIFDWEIDWEVATVAYDKDLRANVKYYLTYELAKAEGLIGEFLAKYNRDVSHARQYSRGQAERIREHVIKTHDMDLMLPGNELSPLVCGKMKFDDAYFGHDPAETPRQSRESTPCDSPDIVEVSPSSSFARLAISDQPTPIAIEPVASPFKSPLKSPAQPWQQEVREILTSGRPVPTTKPRSTRPPAEPAYMTDRVNCYCGGHYRGKVPPSYINLDNMAQFFEEENICYACRFPLFESLLATARKCAPGYQPRGGWPEEPPKPILVPSILPAEEWPPLPNTDSSRSDPATDVVYAIW